MKKNEKLKQPELTKEQKAAGICGLLIGGDHSLRQACEKFSISHSTFLMWVDEDKALADQYTRARAVLLDIKAEELEEIGDRAASAETAVEVAGLRLLSDNRKWLLSKLAPKKYGDKITQEHTGANGGPVVIAGAATDANL